MLALVITLSTIAYHLIMRLLVGTAFQHFMQNRADYHRRWYRVGKFESSVYKHLHVQKWKNKLPTYDTSAFDPKNTLGKKLCRPCVRPSACMKRTLC